MSCPLPAGGQTELGWFFICCSFTSLLAHLSGSRQHPKGRDTQNTWVCPAREAIKARTCPECMWNGLWSRARPGLAGRLRGSGGSKGSGWHKGGPSDSQGVSVRHCEYLRAGAMERQSSITGLNHLKQTKTVLHGSFRPTESKAAF